MKSKSVRDLMVPLADYATVPEDATLRDTVQALEKAWANSPPDRHRHRAILVLGKTGLVVGKIGYTDVLRGLEPKYRDLLERNKLSHMGFTVKFIRTMMSQFNLWEHPLDDICRKAANWRARDFMYKPAADEYIDASATLDQAVHQLVMGSHQSLLATEKEAVVGVLRLTDIFVTVAERIKACNFGA